MPFSDIQLNQSGVTFTVVKGKKDKRKLNKYILKKIFPYSMNYLLKESFEFEMGHSFCYKFIRL